MNTVKDIVRNAIIDSDGDIDIYGLCGVVANWPQVEEPDSFDEEEFHEEPLDLENWEIIFISDDKMVMCGGGDWQEPLTFTLVKLDENTLMSTNGYRNFESGMSNEDIRKALTK